MVADVPLGAILSGGVDSSAVVALMAEASAKAVKTCTIGFDQAALDETGYARAIAERFATDHRTRTVAAGEDRKSVVEGQSVSVRGDLGGRRIIKKKKHNN